jgi:hypothetical protein
MKPTHIYTALVVLAGVTIGICTLFLLAGPLENVIANVNGTSVREITLIEHYNDYFQQNHLSFDDVRMVFADIADEHGAVVAFQVLNEGTLPPGVDSHLIGHFVGGDLYNEQGISGLKHCTDANGFACAHSIVIGALLDKGPSVFDEINDICATVTGNNGYNMCFHGFGHGVLAYSEYHLPEAIKACEQVGTEAFGYQEAEECIGGVIMEMRGGIHNPVVWEKNGAQYLDTKNPLYMCQADYMPDTYRDYCYVYITPFIFDAVTSNDIPSFKDFAPAMDYCTTAPAEFQETCFGGFAKEYLGFILGRDIRLVETISISKLTSLWNACETAPNPEARAYCAKYAIYNLYRSGSHPYEISADFCSVVTEPQSKNACFVNLQDQVFKNNEADLYRDNFCATFSSDYGVNCQPV